jgi:hypothetical protein
MPALIHDNQMNEYSVLVDDSGVRKRFYKCKAAKSNNVATSVLF